MDGGGRWEAEFWVYRHLSFVIDRSDLPGRPVFSGEIDVLYCIDRIGMMGFFVFARKWSGEDLGRNTSP